MRDCVFVLSDGRDLGYNDYGSPDGIPIFLFHGTPGSRIFGFENEPLLNKDNLRIITPDRPSYGLSSTLKNRSISGYSKDIKELADYLGLQKFHVSGVSGGGPYTLACAANLSSRVLSATLISSSAPMDMEGYFNGMSTGNKVSFFMSKYLPWLLKPFIKLSVNNFIKSPAKALEASTSQLCEWDAKTLEEIKTKGQLGRFLEHIQEAYRQGYFAAYVDMLLLSRPWSVDFTKIKCPIFMWHGEADASVPIHPAKKFSEILPNCKTHFIKSAGHLLLENGDIRSDILMAIKHNQKLLS